LFTSFESFANIASFSNFSSFLPLFPLDPLTPPLLSPMHHRPSHENSIVGVTKYVIDFVAKYGIVYLVLVAKYGTDDLFLGGYL